MKSFFTRPISLFCILISSYCFGGTPDEGYAIKIIAKGLKEGSTCVLANYYGEKPYIQDSAKVNAKGEAIFKGTKKWPQGIYLFVPPNKKYFDFVMDAGQNFTIETDTVEYVKYMKIKGSEENKHFFDYQTFMAAKQKEVEPLREQFQKVKNNKDSAKIVQDKINKIDREVKDYKLNFIKTKPKTFVAQIFKAMQEVEIPEAPILPNGRKDSTFAYRYYKSHFFDYLDFSDERLLRTPIFHAKINQYMENLTPQIPDSINISTDYVIGKARVNPEIFKYLVNWLTFKYESSKIMGMDAVFVHMVEQYYITKQVTWIDSTQAYKVMDRGYTLKPLLLGKQAPPVSMVDSTGKRISLYDVKAKYTVLVFWDHDCGHCQKEMPKLAELYKKVKAKGVEVYAIETEDSPDKWKKFIREHQLNWINVQEPDQYNRAVTKKIYDIYSTPVTYLLDENKVIKAKRIDVEQLGNFIDLLEKEKLEKEKEKK
ncbi:MAG: redoxin domain-containing protein [Bacteroidota bacterium]